MIRSSTNFEMNWEIEWVSESWRVCVRFLDVFFEMIGRLQYATKTASFPHRLFFFSPHKLIRTHYVSNILQMIIQINYIHTYIFNNLHTNTNLYYDDVGLFFIFHLPLVASFFVLLLFCQCILRLFYLFIYLFISLEFLFSSCYRHSGIYFYINKSNSHVHMKNVFGCHDKNTQDMNMHGGEEFTSPWILPSNEQPSYRT